MTKQETYRFLEEKNFIFEITEHEAVFHMGELAGAELPYPEADAKNLFVRDDKKRAYYLITVRGDKRVDLKSFRRENGTRPLSFASPEEMFAILKLTPGSVTPLGLLEDEERKAEFYLDEEFFQAPGLIGCHPNDNTATVWLKIRDLINIITEHGTRVHLVKL